MGQFPLLTLRDIVFSKSLIDKKIGIYIKQCQKHNIVWIQGLIAEFHRIFTSKKADVKAKTHALFILKEMITTCSYPVLMLVESFLLNFLTDIADYFIRNSSIQRNSKYFQMMGFSAAYPNIEQLSHNYVVMGFQVLYACAMIRPKQNFQNQELKKNSPFYISLAKIKDKNHKAINEPQLKKKLSIPKLRQKYKHQLAQFDSHSYFYIDHYMKKLQDLIFLSKIDPETDNLDFRILLKRGDSYLTSETVARLAEMIDYVDDFKIKSRALTLLNQMILWGDVESIITVNYTEYFEKIFREFYKIDGSKGLQSGQKIFKDIKSHPEDKKRFYTDFLRCLQTWAEAFPFEFMIFYDKDETQIASPIFKNYRFLKQVRKFVFPQHPFLDKMKIETLLNFKDNEERNKIIIDELNKEIYQLEDFQKVSFAQVQKKLQTSERYLRKLKENIVEGSVEAMMKHLIKFENSFELELQRLEENIDDSVLDLTIERGLICIQIINIIEPQYDRLKRGKTTLKDYIRFCMRKIDFSRKSLTELSLNSSKSIHDRKSQLKSSIISRVNKQRSSIKTMTEQTRLRIIRAKYVQRLQKMANRISAQKDNSFLNTSLFFNKRNSDPFSKLPIQSMTRFKLKEAENNHHQSKSVDKTKSVPKSPRSTGKKVFVVSKYLEKQPIQDLETIKNKIIQDNWNSNKKIPFQEPKKKESSIMERNSIFSFLDQFHSNPGQKVLQSQKNLYKQSFESSQKSKSQKNLDFIRIVDEIYSKSPQSSEIEIYQSPKFGNTSVKEEKRQELQNQDKKSKKGVGLAKKFVDLAEKLIGPKRQVITLSDYAQFFRQSPSDETKKETLSKQLTLIQSEIIQVDRVTVSSENKLTITFYMFPKEKCSRIRIKILETPSIYLNVLQNHLFKVQKTYYEFKNPNHGQQYEFSITGNILQTPILIPKIVIILNQEKPLTFPLPFPLMHFIKFNQVDKKWLGKDFDLANQIVSEKFVRNKQILGSLDDLDDFMSELTEVKAEKNVKIYRTQCKLEKTHFVLEIKEEQDQKISLSACSLSKNDDKSLIAFYIAECMHFFS